MVEDLRKTSREEALAHDCRNLLHSIRGNVDLIELDGRPLAEQSFRLEAVRRATAEAQSLLDQMLERSPENTGVEVLPQPIEIVRSTINAESTTIPDNVELELVADEFCPAISISERNLRRTLQNLIRNAAEALGERGGTITVSLTCCISDLTITIDDNGPGIPFDLQQTIFDPYFSTKSENRGLGLAIVLDLVRLSGGTIHAATNSDGGARFVIQLPFVEKIGIDLNNSSVLPESVIVVDDDQSVLAVTSQLLNHFGVEAITFDSAEKALEQVCDGRVRVDAAVVDLTMPGMDGEQLIYHLRKQFPKLPIIVATGFSEHTKKELERFVKIDFLRKPYGHEALLRALKSCMQF